jgi:peptide/nickel transport system substrate-binding protein
MLSLAACDSQDEDVTGSQEPDSDEQADLSDDQASEDVDQTLVVGAPEDTFVTEGADANLGMFPINANIFETLTRMTPDFQLEPGLATNWEYLGDNTWQFELREDVTFHDGQPFDAEAAQNSFERIAEASGDRLSLDADSAEVVDEHTLEVTTTEPNLALPSQLVHPSMTPMVAPGTDVGSQPTGTGPFQFVEYTPEEQLVVERYDDYWDEPARLEELTFRFIPDGESRWLSLRSDEVDLIYDLPRESLSEAMDTDGIKAGFESGVSPAGSTEIMYFNKHGNEPYTVFSEREVRQAFAQALDREQIVAELWGDSATLTNTVTPSELYGEHADLIEGPEYDPEQAEQLLEEAGWEEGDDGIRQRDGERLTVTMVNGYPPIDLRKPMPQLVQAQVKEVGFEVEIVETPEAGAYFDRLETGEGDIFLERVAQNNATPMQFASAFFYSKAGNSYAEWFAASPEFDELLEEAQATADHNEAARLTAEAMSVAIDDETVVVPLAAAHWLFMMQDDVQGFEPHGSARHVRWDSVYRE